MTVEPGLCGACRHARVIENRAGSRFYLCELSKLLPSFPRYPRLPVLRCRGFQPDAEPSRDLPPPGA